MNRSYKAVAAGSFFIGVFLLVLMGSAARADSPQCNPEASQTIVSDTNTLVSGSPSVPVSPIHPRWTASIPGATWIWGENPIADAVNQTSETFTRTFTIVGTPTGATLDIAADNSYTVSVNGHDVGADSSEFNYQAEGQDTLTIPAADLVSGTNTISFTVTNFAMDGGTMATNPAGLLYSLTVQNNECQVVSINNNSAQECFVPKPGTTPQSQIVFGASSVPTEPTLQSIFTNNGYAITAATDQKDDQTWDGTGNTIDFTMKFVDSNSSYIHVFGYYTGGDLSTFAPLFMDGPAPAPYDGIVPIKSVGDTVHVSVPHVGAPGVGFAVIAYSQGAPVGTWATQTSLNSDSAFQHVVAYNPAGSEYALAFEDGKDGGDKDYNDFVVDLTLSCATSSVSTTTVSTTDTPTTDTGFTNPPVISAQKIVPAQIETTSLTVTWQTDHPATSRVVYDTVPHTTLGLPPNYGYANSTAEDSTLTTSHSVTITGLAPNTTYYFRTVSHGSPEAVSGEIVGATATPTNPTSSNPAPTATGGGTGGGGGLMSGPLAVGYINTPPPAPGTQGKVLGASAYNFTKTLQLGSKGPDVVALQEYLIANGFMPTPLVGSNVTGYFGKLTEAAVKAFQKAHGLEPVGIVGPKTRAILNLGSTQTTPEGGTATSTVTVSATSTLTAPQVQAILNLLQSFNADASVISGVKTSLGAH